MKTPSFSHSRGEAALEEQSDVEDRDMWSGQKRRLADQDLIRKEMSECVREFVDRLPPDYRTVILLSELAGFKNREIADILQISLDTVKIRLHRARASLKKLLDDGCDFYHNEQAILACDRKQPFIKFKKSK
jgi:RNA polymerase sigma-70 factor (ECF subfamily)